VHEHPLSSPCSRVFKWDRLVQTEMLAGHSRLLLHLEGAALGQALRLLQQKDKMLLGHAPTESSLASLRPASFEVKSLLVSGREQDESQELYFFLLPQAYSRLAGGAHMVNTNLQKQVTQCGHYTLTQFVALSDKS